MKRLFSLLLSALMICSFTACGGGQAATKGTTGGAPTVSQILENAAKDEPPLPSSSIDAPLLPPVNAVEPALPAEMEPVAQQPAPEHTPTADGVDIDLTQMNATMVFAEVSNIMYMPDDYIGKIIRMNGMAVSSTDPETGITYHAVIIRDATACCASGLDYVLADGQEYPPDESDATVTGEFELYEENGFFYCQLKNATLGT